jgi:phi13 family phage major tail protein
MMSNKIKYGLKNVHYAVITEAGGVVHYATPVAIPGAVNISLSPAGEKVEFYADDLLYFGANTNQGYEGTLEIALIPDSFRKDVMMEEEDANGAYIENSSATPKNFALLFEFNGDVNATRHVLYKVNAARPDVAGSTKTKNIEPQTETLNIVASPAIDTYYVKASLPYSEDASYTGFFTAVYLKSAVTNTAGSDPANFSKMAAADVEVTTTSSGTTAIKNVLFNGLPVPGVSLTIASLKATIASAYIEGLSLANGAYPIVVEFTKGNAVTYTLTVKD